MGVLTIRALLFGVYTRAPDFWKLKPETNLLKAMEPGLKAEPIAH